MKLLYNCRAPVFWFLAFCAICLTGNLLHAQEPGGESILIMNVNMIRGGSADAKEMVSILVESGKVKLVSTDVISVPEGTLGVDGNGGFIVGVVDIDKPANFLILEKDPRIDFSALADTNANARFIIQNGKVFKNRLAETKTIVDKIPNLDYPAEAYF